MLLKLVSLFFALTVILSGCCQSPASASADTNPTVSDELNAVVSDMEDAESNATSVEENTEMNPCILIVNEKEMNSVGLALINKQYKYAEIPLIAVMHELGANIEWQNINTAVITYKEKTLTLDTQKQDFGLTIPPGTIKAVRKMVDGEVIVDTVSIAGIIKHMMEGKISIDYEKGIVNISNT